MNVVGIIAPTGEKKRKRGGAKANSMGVIAQPGVEKGQGDFTDVALWTSEDECIAKWGMPYTDGDEVTTTVYACANSLPRSPTNSHHWNVQER